MTRCTFIQSLVFIQIRQTKLKLIIKKTYKRVGIKGFPRATGDQYMNGAACNERRFRDRSTCMRLHVTSRILWSYEDMMTTSTTTTSRK